MTTIIAALPLAHPITLLVILSVVVLFTVSVASGEVSK